MKPLVMPVPEQLFVQETKEEENLKRMMDPRDIKTRDGVRSEKKEKRRNKFPVWMES